MKTTKKPATTLRFSPTAWAKLLYLRDAGDTEIGGFGITPPDDFLFVEDICLPHQSCDWAHVAFDDEAVADFFDEQVDAGRSPEQFGRLWIHTHPGTSAEPSSTDEKTFARVFGRAEWAVMFILARGGQSYARLRFSVGPGSDIVVPCDVDFSRPFAASSSAQWEEEYRTHVHVPAAPVPMVSKSIARGQSDDPDAWGWESGATEDWWPDAWADYEDFEQHAQETMYGFVRDF